MELYIVVLYNYTIIQWKCGFKIAENTEMLSWLKKQS